MIWKILVQLLLELMIYRTLIDTFAETSIMNMSVFDSIKPATEDKKNKLTDI